MPRGDAGVLVVGGGFYGSLIATSAAERGRTVTLIEREARLCARASARNQARVHNGYHYPRSFTTAWRSHDNYRRFMADFSACVRRDIVSLYAIARTGSLTSARQFERFCSLIGSPLRPAPPAVAALFSRHAIEEVFEVDEGVFDADALRSTLGDRLAQAGVNVRLGVSAIEVHAAAQGQLVARLSDGTELGARRIVDCTYGAMNGTRGFGLIGDLKREIAEVVIVHVPEELREVAFTIMDGPFGSVLPFPPLGEHSMTHVRYTPHAAWLETDSFRRDPADALENNRFTSRFPSMVRDLSRFVPAVADVTYVTSLFEVKTLASAHELDDGRPILLVPSPTMPGVVSVLGSKIDNVYDVLRELDAFLE